MERAGGQSRGAFVFVLTFFVSFLCQDKKEKRIQVSKTFLLETFLFPSRGKPDIIESFGFLLTFFLDKKSNKKIKPVRKGNFFSWEISAREPAPGTQALTRSLGQELHAC